MDKKKAIRSVSLLWLGSILGAFCAFLIQVILARELGPSSLGMFSAAFGVISLVTPLAGFGVSGFWLKAFGQEGWGGVRWLNSSLKYTLTSTFIVLVFLYLWAVFGPHEEVTRYLLIVLSSCILGQVVVELVSAKFQLEGRYLMLALWQFLPHLLRLVVVTLMLLLFDNLSLKFVAIAYAAIYVFFLIIGCYFLWRMCTGGFSLKGHGPSSNHSENIEQVSGFLKVAKESWPFGLVGVFYLVYFQSDIIFLKYVVGDGAAGIYNVAFVVMAAVYIFPNIVYQKFLLPMIHRWAEHDLRAFQKVYHVGNKWMLLLGIVAMFCIWGVAPWGIPFMFGIEYKDAVALTMILGIAAPVRFLASSMGAILSTQNHLLSKLYIMALAAVINVGLNFIFIPIYGTLGAAITTVATEVIILAAMYMYVRRHILTEFLAG